MNRRILGLGIALLALGAGSFLFFVLPSIGDATSATRFDTWLSRGPALLAVAVASFGLAGGAALIGIGLGRWKRPKPSPYDGSPEV
jgi:hypothetical protein